MAVIIWHKLHNYLAESRCVFALFCGPVSSDTKWVVRMNDRSYRVASTVVETIQSDGMPNRNLLTSNANGQRTQPEVLKS